MGAVKISTIIICFLFFIQLPVAAEKIFCKKYTGKYKIYNFTVLFSHNGKMLIEVNDRNGGGYFSTPGTYTVKNSKLDFFYKGLNRTIFLEGSQIKVTPYTFGVDDDYITIVVLPEDKSFASSCK